MGGTHGCGIGLFCADKKNSTDMSRCEKLKGYGSECKSSFECEMSTVCYVGICSKIYFEFDIGEEIKRELLSDDFIKNHTEYMCDSGYFSEEVNKCAEFKISNKTNDDNYAECDITNSENACVYDVLINGNSGTKAPTPLKKNCQCGFNVNGKAYCPIDSYNFKSKYKNLERR